MGLAIVLGMIALAFLVSDFEERENALSENDGSGSRGVPNRRSGIRHRQSDRAGVSNGASKKKTAPTTHKVRAVPKEEEAVEEPPKEESQPEAQ